MSAPTDDDMDTPVTKRELHEILKNLFGYLDGRFEAIDKRFEAFEVANRNLMLEMEKRFSAETKAAVQEVTRYHRDELGTVDDKYKDLPDRVTKLEAKVFAPKRQRRR